MLWGWSVWYVGGGGGCEDRGFWNGMGFEYLTFLLLKIHILRNKCSSMFH
jgi:hypothetical protein